MVHFAPLLGYEDSPGIEEILRLAQEDTHALINGGVDAIMFENNYDTPHKEFLDPESIAALTYITTKIVQQVPLPIGLSVLWNDYKTALSIAVLTNISFIRVPVFVDSVETNYGRILARHEEVLLYRKKLGVEHVLLLTDIHVKHATMLEEKTLTQSTKEAIAAGSDGIIITGKWTADAPKLDDLKETRKAAGDDFPILIGSGVTEENVLSLLSYANGIIIGTALKEGSEKPKEEEINIKPWESRISEEKTKHFMNIVKAI